MEEGPQLLCGVPSHTCSSQHVELHPPSLEGGLDSVTHFKRREDGGKKRNFMADKPGRNHLNEVLQVCTTSADSGCSQVTPEVVQGEEHFTSVVFLPKTYHPRLTMRKHATNPEGEAAYNTRDPYSPKRSWARGTRDD